MLSAAGFGLANIGLGALSGATSPNVPIWNYKKQGVNYLGGYADERNKAARPLLEKLRSMGLNGGQMSSMNRAKMVGGELAQLGGNLKAVQEGINERALGRGAGAGDGIAEAGHIQAAIAGLDAKRQLLGQVSAADVGSGKQIQMQALGGALGLYNQENQQENDQIWKQFETKSARAMQGNRGHRIINGMWSGLNMGAGPNMGGGGQQPGNMIT